MQLNLCLEEGIVLIIVQQKICLAELKLKCFMISNLNLKMLKEKMIHAMEESNHPPLLGTLSLVIVSVCLVVEADKSVGLPVLSYLLVYGCI